MPVTMHKETLGILIEDQTVRISAKVTASTTFEVVVHTMVERDEDDFDNLFKSTVPFKSERMTAGERQSWTSPGLEGEHLELVKLTEVGGDYTPIIIEATAVGSDGALGPREQTYCRLVLEQSGTYEANEDEAEELKSDVKPARYSIRVLKQRAVVDGVGYDLQDIFGIEKMSSEAANLDCVICLMEPKDTAVLPCRHLCLCGQCADVMRHQSRRCPICRQPIASFLVIEGARERAALIEQSRKKAMDSIS